MSIATEVERLQTAKTDIKNAIENKGVIVGDGTIDTYAEKIDEISSGGQGSYYDEFWDNYQQNGDREDYFCAFVGKSWNENILKPKYDIIPTSANQTFKSASSINVNISDYFESQGIELDFSKCSNFTETFAQPSVLGVGTLDTRSADTLSSTFVWNNRITEVRELILKDDGSQTFPNTFIGTSALKTLIIESGVIGNDFQVASNVLDETSIKSIVNHLSDDKGATLTLKKNAVIKVFGSVDAPEWIELITSKSNEYNGKWTISLST